LQDIRDTGDHLGVIGVHLEEEHHPGLVSLLHATFVRFIFGRELICHCQNADTEAEEVEAAVSHVVQCVTVLAVIVEAPYKVALLWTDIAGRHQLNAVNHLLGAEADQSRNHLGAHNHQSKSAEASQYHPRRVPLGRQVLFPMEMDLLNRDREYM